MRSQRSAATRPSLANRGATILNTTLVIGSVIATLLGADLAARQEQANTGSPGLATAENRVAAFSTPRSLATLPNLPAPSTLGHASVDTLLNMPLAPIPSIVLRAPLTRSRSSR